MSGSSMNNNGAHLANKHQMVVVHANYRLAEFGYWYSDNEPDAANAGFLDQQLAIEWVRYCVSYSIIRVNSCQTKFYRDPGFTK